MSHSSVLEHRLMLLGITEDIRHNVRLYYPSFRRDIHTFSAKFYKHMQSTPEGKKLFGNQDIKNHLIPKQEGHWLHLFSCNFDEAYLRNAIRIGRVHYQKNIPPYLYMVGYNFFHCRIIYHAAETFQPRLELPALLASISKIVTLDMDLALSAYTREHWRGSDVVEV